MNKIILLIIILGVGLIAFKTNQKNALLAVADTKENELSDAARYAMAMKEVKRHLKTNSNYNPDVSFLLDMKRPSGRNRFFVVDLKKDQIIDQGLVAHGSGSETGKKNRLKFSNIDNSHATSLGSYTIGSSYKGKFGKAYKLYGLDSSNSNAYARNIVLHKYDSMPYDEQVDPICLSEGCPMVNVEFYKRLQTLIDSSKKQIILHIYY
ncbi:murein L,D-transpeptidase catalytic domain-containing protein [Sphingobacterium sp.]|uniref:murein L,D-transpeptidase catalytic domain-containing protein n=1 Tax=Sphingobacterium sp. TaxID=341027 RepID=UPI0028AD4069|nr:murein L,D-transpeptidase catalytic domain family protein [Sphingobacterium sp.]